jgi:hypothetical protein
MTLQRTLWEHHDITKNSMRTSWQYKELYENIMTLQRNLWELHDITKNSMRTSWHYKELYENIMTLQRTLWEHHDITKNSMRTSWHYKELYENIMTLQRTLWKHHDITKNCMRTSWHYKELYENIKTLQRTPVFQLDWIFISRSEDKNHKNNLAYVALWAAGCAARTHARAHTHTNFSCRATIYRLARERGISNNFSDETETAGYEKSRVEWPPISA